MTRSVALLIGLFAWAMPSAAQTRIGIRAGITGTSTLVRDSIVDAFSVRPDIGPSIGFGIETPLNATYRVGIGLSTAWGHLTRHDPTGSIDVVPLSTWTPTVGLHRALFRDVSAYGAMGAIIYRADRNASNLFRRGSTPMPLVGLGVSADRPMGNGLQLRVDLGYEIHRFTTPALSEAGFNGQRPVHRVTLSVGVSRGL